MARVIHFEIVVADVERASAFYRSVFNWRLEKWNGPMDYWLVITGSDPEPGIDGGMSVGEPNMKNGELTLGVDSVDEVVAEAVKAGGSIVSGKHPIPGVGYLAYVRDTEGNQFGLMQSDAAAAM